MEKNKTTGHPFGLRDTVTALNLFTASLCLHSKYVKFISL